MNRKDWIENPKIVSHPAWLRRWRQDPFSVQPVYIEISPVGMCNHRCTFCAPEMLGYPNRSLDTNLLIARLREMKQLRVEDPDGLGIKAIQYAGEGEPTLHKDLAKIFAETRKAGIDIGMLTNGTGLTEKLAREIIPLVNGYIQVSINAGTSESYAKIHRTPTPKHWDLIWHNLDKAVQIKHRLGVKDCDIGANMTVLVKETIDHQRGNTVVPTNWREMEQLIQYAIGCGLDYVSFKPYSQHLYSQETAKLYGDMSYRNLMNEITETGKELMNRYNHNDFEVIFRFSRFEEYEAEERGYCTCRATPTLWSYIQSDGKWISCSAYWTDERFTLGNINTQSVKEIWFGERRREHLKFVLNDLDITECRKTCHPDKENGYLDKISRMNDEGFNQEIISLESLKRPKRANFI
ncbi:MAG: hypothetical protein A3B86_02600 [Candidatus Yanofskybacteria bacterium RIFCSPHIGHO2_02_FULL_38_22b]|uniref:Radical SAM core domain-containing protein n=1 Tax=Candidatus Yanofskybacteria bacterium RIFCSPHIGHO2_02_FULL_38_22b TaxID=1802673 RepID=A0A1F8F3L9_9BACT|nr:MAG: hypothetical protein A2816_03255 [Candidatus Yanofskybacteria bacterium RIFCSPHIGHO2_01_FULL_39_44]OGN07745.1 MAG: hypothetical protein A3B86_02600 [Candidatus Yanofskybacteria bacterium RIFCSPHIGHO2_02_FULL_38_22b]OGN20627.1 MAG: hypothetical protein A2910_02435 [Candidatus Yanofskybacteria bacterium RIFCSPLOWO2_01_FULL_39_28]